MWGRGRAVWQKHGKCPDKVATLRKRQRTDSLD